MNIVEKILKKHLRQGELIPGSEISINIDQTLTQDATGTMAYLQFESLHIPRVKTELSVSYVDHNTLQEGYENADDHHYLQSVAAKYGILYSRAGNGICHQVHLERFAVPGKTLLGSDSHTPTAGGIGCLGIGAGGLDVAVAMGGGSFHLTCPKVVRINLNGKLGKYVTAKDVILKVLKTLTTKGNTGTVVEYGGTGIKTLSVPERATITNMGAELGVTTSIFPSDSVTKAFMKAQKRGKSWKELAPDRDAKYAKTLNIDLAKIVPLMACPHSPDMIKPVRNLAGKKVDQVIIGSCTNSSLRDIMTVAALLKGQTVHPDVSFGVSCGSRQVLEMAMRKGAIADLVCSGARILESTCGFCIGNGQSPNSEAVSIRTSNRNFEGRSGTKSAQVYLSSPESAAAAAIKGKIADPRDVFGRKKIASFKQPASFLVDDSMILKPASPRKTIRISRGPNIGDPPKNIPMKNAIAGIVSIKLEDKVTTDHIMPAGSRLKYRSNIAKYATYVFEGIDPEFSANCLENVKNGLDNIIVAGTSYGQGSSREHAAICPMYLGVKIVLAKSFERIHRTNLINFGIIPLTFVNPQDYSLIEAGDRLDALHVLAHLRTMDSELLIVDELNDLEIHAEHSLTEREREIIIAGGLLNYTKKKQ